VPQSHNMIFSLGEILWDIFPEGKKIGGAPANVVFYLSRLGENPVLISRVGKDSFGGGSSIRLPELRS